MKIADGFLLKTIAGTNIVVPVGSNTVSFRAVISLNETGAFLWNELKEEKTLEELVAALLKEYSVDHDTATADVKEFLDTLEKENLLQ